MASQDASLKWVRLVPALINIDGFRFARRRPRQATQEAWKWRAELLRQRGKGSASPVLGPVPGPFFVLTHIHSDHTTGLEPSFGGTVLTTPITADLLVHRRMLPREKIHSVRISKPGSKLHVHRLCDGVEVILLDANHCPGSAIVVLLCRELRRCVIHCGDMRASEDAIKGWCTVLRQLGVTVAPPHAAQPLKGATPTPAGSTDDACAAPCASSMVTPASSSSCPSQSPGIRVSLAYLDSTYTVPGGAKVGKKWDFPSQAEVLRCLGGVASRYLRRDAREGESTLFVVGTYSVGKERAAEAVARACGGRVVVLDKEKAETLRLCRLLVPGGMYARSLSVRDRCLLCPLSGVSTEGLERLLELGSVRRAGFTRTVGFRLTGWSFGTMRGRGALSSGAQLLENAAKRPSVSRSGRASVIALPYSEHSSGPELQAFARAIMPLDVVFTVNADTPSKRRELRERLRPALPWLPSQQHTLLAAMSKARPSPSASSTGGASSGRVPAASSPAASSPAAQAAWPDKDRAQILAPKATGVAREKRPQRPLLQAFERAKRSSCATVIDLTSDD